MTCPRCEWHVGARLQDRLNEVERDAVIKALAQCERNRTHAARALGMSLRQLRRLIAHYEGRTSAGKGNGWKYKREA